MTATLEQHVHGQLDALCGDAGRVALGYSGGGDSHALMVLAHSWARQRDIELLVLTVDHGLRPESAAEAHQAIASARALGLNGRVLDCVGSAPTSAIQETARSWRHEALARACNSAGVSRLLLAHTLDDQAETALMRLQAGGRWQGLAGMGEDDVSPSWPAGRGIRLGRPLLTTRRRDLRAWLASQGESWIEDPSNDDTRFTRVRLRRALEKAGAGPQQRLAVLAGGLGRARRALRRSCAQILPTVAEVTAWGGVKLDVQRLRLVPQMYRSAILGLLAQSVSGSGRETASSAIALLDHALGSTENITAGGVMMQVSGDWAWMVRDPGAVLGRVDRAANPQTVEINAAQRIWDGRLLHPAQVRAEPLGVQYDGLGERDALADVPGFARASLACFRCEGRVISIPGLLGADSVDCKFLVLDRLESRLSAFNPSFLPPRTSLMSKA